MIPHKQHVKNCLLSVTVWKTTVLQILKSIWASRAGSISTPVTVFQIELSEKRLPLCGGGRYDNLIASFGGSSIPGAGFAFQFDALVEALLTQTRQLLAGEKTTSSPRKRPKALREHSDLLKRCGKQVRTLR